MTFTVPHCPNDLAARALILAALALPAAGATDEGESMTPSEVEAVRTLRSLREPDGPEPEAAGLQIAELGPEVGNELLSILEKRRVPSLGEEGPQQLSEPQTAAILRALEEHGRGSVLARVTERFAAPQTSAARAAAIQAIGAVGEAKDLQLLCTWAWSTEEDPGAEELNEWISTTLRQAATATLLRDPGGYAALQAAWAGIPELLQPDLVLAVGATADGRGMEVLDEVYRWNAELRYLITTQVPRLGPSNRGEVNRSLAEQFEILLREDEEKRVSAALLALGHLEGYHCVPHLIDLLSDPRPGVSRAAYWSLCELTGQHHAATTEIWKRWYNEQLRWHDREEAAVVAVLRDPHRDPTRVLEALRAVTVHRLHRHEMALWVGPRLHDDDERVRRTACAVLADLDSRWAAADLILALGDSSEAVQQAASQALASITGEQREPTPEAWADYPAPLPSAY